ncbi:MAG: BamA/TamA family outer membrane protein [Bacteroidales bacterium]|nr:BamA/TamA family outer membrane protein [Bacteroidales bacterium]
MKKKNPFFFIIRVLLYICPLLLFHSCNVARHLNEEEKLLVKNDIRIDKSDKHQNISEYELKRYIKQKPNKKFLFFFRFHTSAYNWGHHMRQQDSASFDGLGLWLWKRKRNFRSWLMRNGEPPAVLDTALTDQTVTQLSYFLFTKGHFDAEVERMFTPPKIQFPFIRKNRVVAKYIIYPGKPYYINDTFTTIKSPDIRRLINQSFGTPMIRTGTIYDEKVLQQTRDRINRLLKDNGYYYFNKTYISFGIDSSLSGNRVNIELFIDEEHHIDPAFPDSLTTRPHKRCRINNVYINPQYDGSRPSEAYHMKSVSVKTGKDSASTVTYYFFYKNKPAYNTNTLLQKILITPGNEYSLRDVELTYNYLAELINFRYTNIEFRESHDSLSDSAYHLLDCYINLSREDKQYYTVQANATNTSGDPGLSANFVYLNRNLFKGAEIFNLTLNGALEVQKIIDETQQDNTIYKNLPFNTMVYGAEMNLLIPKFLIPWKQKSLSKRFKPKTSLIAGVNYQQRPDYRRYITKFSFGYKWQYSNTSTFAFNIPEYNAVSIFPAQSFLDKLEALNDKRLINAYSDHIVANINASFRYTDQLKRKGRNYTYLLISTESAGAGINALQRLPWISYKTNESGNAMIFNIPFAQYVRFTVDYRRYFTLSNTQMLAFRTMVGLGIPYGNMDVLPFEKSFFVGGANSIRAWPIRTVGPGSFSGSSDNTAFDRTGDYSFEASVEYRFPIYSTFNGAVFIDAGNIWLKNKSVDYPNGDFDKTRFFKELAIGTGLGLRLDFSVFILRLDAGVKLLDPSLPENNRWRIGSFKMRQVNWNFGIGYPF